MKRKKNGKNEGNKKRSWTIKYIFLWAYTLSLSLSFSSLFPCHNVYLCKHTQRDAETTSMITPRTDVIRNAAKFNFYEFLDQFSAVCPRRSSPISARSRCSSPFGDLGNFSFTHNWKTCFFSGFVGFISFFFFGFPWICLSFLFLFSRFLRLVSCSFYVIFLLFFFLFVCCIRTRTTSLPDSIRII